MQERVRILYKNYRGDWSSRVISPQTLWYGTTEFHKEPQHLLDALDIGKGAVRTFSMQDLKQWQEGDIRPRRYNLTISVNTDSMFDVCNALSDIDKYLEQGVLDYDHKNDRGSWSYALVNTHEKEESK